MGRAGRGKTKFKHRWTEEFSWVSPCPTDIYLARCTLCRVVFKVDSMGRQAVVSHSKGMEHKRALNDKLKTVSIRSFSTLANKSQSEEMCSSASTSQTSHSTKNICIQDLNALDVNSDVQQQVSSVSMKDFLAKDSCTKAEILWCLQTVVSHASLRSAAKSVSLFTLMFPDSEIAKGMQLQKSKTSYAIVYGLGYYFHEELMHNVKNVNFFVVGFDESLNKVAQKQQMDVSLRYWDTSKNHVTTRYLNSVFLEHTAASDLLNGLKAALEGLDLNCILQLSMDGPNVNLKLQRDMAKELRPGREDPKILDMGSCGLHVMHNSFKAGIKGTAWNIIEFLRALYYLFKDVPARRADFVEVCGERNFSLKFCGIRWLENANVAARAISILPGIRKYVTCVAGSKKEPKCHSFQIIAASVKDKLLLAKLTLFQSLATEMEPFLRDFQTDAPVAPFLYEAIVFLMKNIMFKFVKRDIIESCQLKDIDVMKKENLIRCEEVDLGYATRQALRKCDGANQKELLLFRKDCRTCFQLLVAKIMFRSPLKFPLTKSLQCLNPTVIAAGNGDCYLSSALEILTESNLIAGINTADDIARDYKEFCNDVLIKTEMKSYNKSDTRLDSFWMMLLRGSKWEKLKSFVQQLLILSHGNSHLERGFSVNAECLIENMNEESLIAQRCVFDAVSVAGGVERVEVTKAMINSYRQAHMRYKQALERKRKEENSKIERQEKKVKVAREIQELESKRRKLVTDTQVEIQKIEEQINKLQK